MRYVVFSLTNVVKETHLRDFFIHALALVNEQKDVLVLALFVTV